MHKTIYGRSAKRVQYKIENHIYKKDTTKKKETSKQTKNGRRNLRIQQILSSVWKCTKTKILIQ